MLGRPRGLRVRSMICIKTYANLFEAEVAGRTLEAHGLEVRLSTDDARDWTSGFGGVQLFVDDADAERAVAILTAPDGGAAAGADQDVSPERQRHPGRRIIAGEPQDVRRIPASESQFGVEVWDCSGFTQTMLSTSGDLEVAASFVRQRAADGIEYRGQEPADASVHGCRLTYHWPAVLEGGPLFKAEQMEDKRDIYYHGGNLYLARSWTGQLVYRAAVEQKDEKLVVTELAIGGDQPAEYELRVVDFLIKSHVLGQVVPHPLPADLPTEHIGLFSFAQFGRRCAYGSYEDTTTIRV